MTQWSGLCPMPEITFRDLFCPDYIEEEVWEQAVAKMDGIIFGEIIISKDQTHLHIVINEEAKEQFIEALKEALEIDNWELDPDWWKQDR